MNLKEYQLNTSTSGIGLHSIPTDAVKLFSEGETDHSDLPSSAIGFPFRLGGETHNHIVFSPNGWLLLSGETPSSTEFITTSEFWATTSWKPRTLLMPWATMAKVFGGVYTWLDTTGNNAKRVVHWDIYSSKTQSTTYYERLKFQAILYKNGTVEYKYEAPILHGSFSGGSLSEYGAVVGARLLGVSETNGDFRDFLGTNGTPAGSAGPFGYSYYSEGAKSVDNSVDIHYPGSPLNTTNNKYYFTFSNDTMFGVALGPNEHIGKLNMFKIKIISDENLTEFN